MHRRFLWLLSTVEEAVQRNRGRRTKAQTRKCSQFHLMDRFRGCLVCLSSLLLILSLFTDRWAEGDGSDGIDCMGGRLSVCLRFASTPHITGVRSQWMVHRMAGRVQQCNGRFPSNYENSGDCAIQEMRRDRLGGYHYQKVTSGVESLFDSVSTMPLSKSYIISD
jgi:hypothetical protein